MHRRVVGHVLVVGLLNTFVIYAGIPVVTCEGLHLEDDHHVGPVPARWPSVSGLVDGLQLVPEGGLWAGFWWARVGRCVRKKYIFSPPVPREDGRKYFSKAGNGGPRNSRKETHNECDIDNMTFENIFEDLFHFTTDNGSGEEE